MDSLTQLAFGAACGEAVLGQKVGRKALWWGAVLGTLPDLDVFIPLGGPVNDFFLIRWGVTAFHRFLPQKLSIDDRNRRTSAGCQIEKIYQGVLCFFNRRWLCSHD